MIDEERCALIHELVLSNRIVENLVKGVSEINGQKSAEQVIQNFLFKGRESEDKMDLKHSSSLGPGQSKSEVVDWTSNSKLATLEKLAERTPRLVNKFSHLYSANVNSSSSLPKNRQKKNYEQVEAALEAVGDVCELIK